MITKLNEYNEYGNQMYDIYGHPVYTNTRNPDAKAAGGLKRYATQDAPNNLSKDITTGLSKSNPKTIKVRIPKKDANGNKIKKRVRRVTQVPVTKEVRNGDKVTEVQIYGPDRQPLFKKVIKEVEEIEYERDENGKFIYKEIPNPKYDPTKPEKIPGEDFLEHKKYDVIMKPVTKSWLPGKVFYQIIATADAGGGDSAFYNVPKGVLDDKGNPAADVAHNQQALGGFLECSSTKKTKEEVLEEFNEILSNSSGDRSWIYNGAFVCKGVKVKNGSVVAPVENGVCVLSTKDSLLISNSNLRNVSLGNCSGAVISVSTNESGLHEKDTAIRIQESVLDLKNTLLHNKLIQMDNVTFKVNGLSAVDDELTMLASNADITVSRSKLSGQFKFTEGSNTTISGSTLTIGVTGKKNACVCSGTSTITDSSIATINSVVFSDTNMNLKGEEIRSNFGSREALDFSGQTVDETDPRVKKKAQDPDEQSSKNSGEEPDIRAGKKTDDEKEVPDHIWGKVSQTIKDESVLSEADGPTRSQYGDISNELDAKPDTVTRNIGVPYGAKLTRTEKPNPKHHEKFDFYPMSRTRFNDLQYLEKDGNTEKKASDPEGSTQFVMIKANMDFTNGHGEEVKKDDWGGYLQHADNLDQSGTCWVGKGAVVEGKDQPYVEDAAVVTDEAFVAFSYVLTNAFVAGRGTRVTAGSTIDNYAQVIHGAEVKSSKILDRAVVAGHGVKIEKATVEGDVKVVNDNPYNKTVVKNCKLVGSFIVEPGMKIVDVEEVITDAYFKKNKHKFLPFEKERVPGRAGRRM